MSKSPSQDPGLPSRPVDDSIPLEEAIFQAYPDLLFHLDQKGKIIDYRAGNTAALYTAPENFLGQRMVDILPPDVGRIFAKAFRTTLKSGKVTSLEYGLSMPDGHRTYQAKCMRRSATQISIMVRDITDLKQAEAAARRQLEFVTELYESAQELSKKLDSQTLGKYVVQTCVGKFGVDAAWVGSVPNHRPSAAYSHEIRDGQPEYSVDQARPTSGEINDLLQHKKHLVVEDRTPAVAPLTKVFFPLISQDKVIGALGLASRQAGFFAPDRISFFYAYSLLAASAMENARLFEDSNRRLNQMQALRSIDLAILSALDLESTAALILQEAARQIDVDALNLLVLDPKTKMLNSIDSYGFKFNAFQHSLLQVGENFGGLAALERQVVQVRNLDRDPKSFARASHFTEEGFKTYLGVPLVVRNEVKGVLEIFQRREFEPDVDWLGFLEMIANQMAIAIDNSLLLEVLHSSNVELATAYEATIEGLSRALELRDRETEGHTLRVTEMTLYLSREMGISGASLTHIRQGGLLHDIGKMGIPDAILLKPGGLTSEEWETMRQHPIYAYQVLSQIEYFKPALDIPLYHHEKWDGSGYPHGLKREQIPIAARIFSVVDVYDALTSDRPYRSAWTKEEAIVYIREQSGRYFDPDIVQAFMQMVQKGHAPEMVEAPFTTIPRTSPNRAVYKIA
jgi:HD-GYP domain-containing protein (c-di-GMP phosphodiesterase class II)